MKIAVLGGYGLGLTMRVARVPGAGETVTGGEFSGGPGGKGSNQAIAAARLGATVELLTAIGPDAEAADAIRLWEAEGVGHAAVMRSSRPTMRGFILVDGEGENRIAIAPGALDDLTELSGAARAIIAAADLLVVSLEIPVETAAQALRAARAAGVRTLLNPAPAADLPLSFWRDVDIFTPNLGEAGALLEEPEGSDPADLARRLHDRTGALVVLTAGASGVFVHGTGVALHVPPFAVDEIVDSTGAGDAFTGALAAALLEHEDLESAARFAAAAGALCVTRSEVIPALPARPDIERLLAQSNERNTA